MLVPIFDAVNSIKIWLYFKRIIREIGSKWFLRKMRWAKAFRAERTACTVSGHQRSEKVGTRKGEMRLGRVYGPDSEDLIGHLTCECGPLSFKMSRRQPLRSWVGD